MNRWISLFCAVAIAGLVGCSHKEKTEAAVTPTAPPPVDRSFVNDADKQVAHIEDRLDTLRDSKELKKFGKANEGLRGELNKSYMELGGAKEELAGLRFVPDAEYPKAKDRLQERLSRLETSVDGLSAKPAR